ncbi:MAG: hypothetical protein HC849_10445 [Oscillatoriales cyanobacterium RU_3_3]|nr:hypothetical protein [Oscillatoriales cyanobacterium RU_3_3]NJR22580.1 hypothetical protein [Richelia sp. CSU_2_1]
MLRGGRSFACGKIAEGSYSILYIFMALPKKGTRLIEVNDVKYRWVVKPDDDGLRLVIGLAENAGQKMTIWVEHNNIISPGLVRKAILSALDRGWHPQQKGQEIIFHLKSQNSDRDNRNAVTSQPEVVLQQVFQVSQKSQQRSAPCPVCGVDILGRWDRTGKPIKQEIKGARFFAIDGLWQWCSHCQTFYQQRSKKL